jgi:hypothetical protein
MRITARALSSVSTLPVTPLSARTVLDALQADEKLLLSQLLDGDRVHDDTFPGRALIAIGLAGSHWDGENRRSLISISARGRDVMAAILAGAAA